MDKRRGFTLVELCVVIVIIAILAAILFPVFSKARSKARQASCLSNVKNIARAFVLYQTDCPDVFAEMDKPGSIETSLIVQGDIIPECFACPSDKAKLGADNSFPYQGKTYRASYGWNMSLVNSLSEGVPSSKVVLLVETKSTRLSSSPLYEGSEELAARHLETVNMAFWDGRAKMVPKRGLDQMVKAGELPWAPRSWSGIQGHLPKEQGRYLLEVGKDGKTTIDKIE